MLPSIRAHKAIVCKSFRLSTRKFCTNSSFQFLNDLDVDTIANKGFIVKDNFLGRYKKDLPIEIFNECEQILKEGFLMPGHVVNSGSGTYVLLLK